MGRSDLGNILTEPLARVVAVCDLDSHRLAAGKKMAEDFYTERGESGADVKPFHDYHDILASPDIDAVVVTVPDHSHAIVAIEAAIAGKHVYVQKPVIYSIAEAIGLRKAVEAKKIILQTGSQQRSEHPWHSFRAASEVVRNGRLGQLKAIKIGIGDKPSAYKAAPMTAPPPLRASDKKILSPLGGSAVRWMPSKTHHGNWLESIAANRQPIAPIQQSARSREACAAAWIGMKLKRKLTWDAAMEKFVGDDAANALRSRPARKLDYDFEVALKKAGIA
jgi:hypothetical protein